MHGQSSIKKSMTYVILLIMYIHYVLLGWCHGGYVINIYIFVPNKLNTRNLNGSISYIFQILFPIFPTFSISELSQIFFPKSTNLKLPLDIGKINKYIQTKGRQSLAYFFLGISKQLLYRSRLWGPKVCTFKFSYL